jgi:hypothetical protein
MITSWWFASVFYEIIWGVQTFFWFLTTGKENLITKWKNIILFNTIVEIANWSSAKSGYWAFFVLLTIGTLVLPATSDTNVTFYDDLTAGSPQTWVGVTVISFYAILSGLNTFI